MNKLLRKERLFLHYLIKLNFKEAKLLLKKLNRSQVKVICGIIYNAVKNTFYIKKVDLDILKKFNSSWRILVNKRTGLNKKIRELVKRSKELPLILNAALKWIPLK